MIQYVPQANTTELQELTGNPSDFDFVTSTHKLLELSFGRPDQLSYESSASLNAEAAPLNVSKQFFSAIRADGTFEVLTSGTVNLADFAQTDRSTVIVADTIRLPPAPGASSGSSFLAPPTCISSRCS